MAGAGYKLFNTGDVLTAAQVNTYLQEQAVMRFANATARTTALSGVLAEGMVSYLDDTNVVQVYNGSAWVNVGEAGDITAVTAGTGLSGGGSSGDVTLTNTVATTFDSAGDLLVGTGSDTWKRLAIGTAGQVLKVNSGATDLEWGADSTGSTFVGCKLTKTGTQSVSNATWTALTWDSEVFDTDNFHSNTTNNTRITIPSGKAGKYLFIAQNRFDSNATGYRGLRFKKNGSADFQLHTQPAVNGAETASVISMIFDLAVNDYIEATAFQNSSGNLSTSFTEDIASFSCVYLGA